MTNGRGVISILLATVWGSFGSLSIGTVLCLLLASTACAQLPSRSSSGGPDDVLPTREFDSHASASTLGEQLHEQLADWVPHERLKSSAQLVATMTLLGLIPAVLLMTTSYVRIAIILSLLRQAFGVQQLMPAQVTTAMAMFCTGLIMWPTWTAVHDQGLKPLLAANSSSDLNPILEKGVQPVRDFMIRQICANRNTADVHLFLGHPLQNIVAIR